MEQREIMSDVPDDTEHPVMYERAVYILGIIGVLAVAGIIGLAAFGKAVDAGLAALGGTAIGALAMLLTPRREL